MKMHKICSCFGHQKINITIELRRKVESFIRHLIKYEDYDIFYFGGFSDFDDLCWQVVSELRKEFPHVQRYFCVVDPHFLNPQKRPQWLNNEDYENIIYLDIEFDWWYTRIYYRNMQMIFQSDFVLFYVCNKNNSGAYKAMKYAEKIKVPNINFAEKTY